ncbi:hypothetical protein C1X89_31480 [Pseudomonas sp. GP01-A8]|nr:hypothetical protein C1X90_27870 [Pseudomonas sp. GP01-A9]PMU24678.1 hypothetical protein C1X88_24715 [Pseudomonas sp. GP01-A13]PMU32112.1 hypothetical protein C1X89_31480 [Pseudomonas sp. GP01-A8]PMU48568.1 hypothetical protein C1X87_19435 [Pseudomonas sp. GP01-A14]PMU50626.1 hypothetical protein C1X85_23820 [Pseudomonas sp. GP01-A6]PMU61123.1 hypothetical protein C1X86_19700 [Pseudomonas sp. GP01-A3]PMU70303.1 hypothetical protein C1X84_23960 [Pseudomonas sp. GP01-A1]PMU78741.1 hypothet
MWERACSRKRWFSRCLYCLTRRFREQARSHILFAFQFRIRHLFGVKNNSSDSLTFISLDIRQFFS